MQIQQRTKKYLSREDLSKRWNVSMGTIIKLHNDDNLPRIRIRKRFFYPLDQIEAYEESNTFYPRKVTLEGYRIAKTSIGDIAKMPIENIIALPNEDIAKLAREADKALAEAENLKDWIDGIVALKKSINDTSNINNYKTNLIGGHYEQAADY